MKPHRQVIDSNLLNDVIELPEYFKNRRIEVFIFPAEERTCQTIPTRSQIDEMLKGSVTESLLGVLPHSDKTLEDYRSERLKKHELAD